jgi:hypothetical protein
MITAIFFVTVIFPILMFIGELLFVGVALVVDKANYNARKAVIAKAHLPKVSLTSKQRDFSKKVEEWGWQNWKG